MNKRPGCEHQFPEEPLCQPAFFNHYRCEDCGVSWEDDWSATCDDECPKCGADYTPVRSEEVAPCACRYFR